MMTAQDKGYMGTRYSSLNHPFFCTFSGANSQENMQFVNDLCSAENAIICQVYQQQTVLQNINIGTKQCGGEPVTSC